MYQHTFVPLGQDLCDVPSYSLTCPRIQACLKCLVVQLSFTCLTGLFHFASKDPVREGTSTCARECSILWALVSRFRPFKKLKVSESTRRQVKEPCGIACEPPAARVYVHVHVYANVYVQQPGPMDLKLE